MKKAKAAEQPMGIVIATGRATVTQPIPRVRAYYWCDVGGKDEAEVAKRVED